MSRLKPWPRDAVMVVACRAGEANLQKMEGIHPDKCRECSCAVHADTRTVRNAHSHPLGLGRPVKFFCVPCAELYDMGGKKMDVQDESGCLSDKTARVDFVCTGGKPWAPGRNLTGQAVRHPDAYSVFAHPTLAFLGIVECPHCKFVYPTFI